MSGSYTICLWPEYNGDGDSHLRSRGYPSRIWQRGLMTTSKLLEVHFICLKHFSSSNGCVETTLYRAVIAQWVDSGYFEKHAAAEYSSGINNSSLTGIFTASSRTSTVEQVNINQVKMQFSFI